MHILGMHLFRMHSLRIHLFKMHLFRMHLVRMHLVRMHLFRMHLFWMHLLGMHLFRMHLFRMHLFWMHLVRMHLFRNEFKFLSIQRRVRPIHIFAPLYLLNNEESIVKAFLLRQNCVQVTFIENLPGGMIVLSSLSMFSTCVLS